ncbi:MAG: MerC domain-containing protein [Pseudomonadales bacterium]|nr:MerC domain-containing protein [Pseudomonadales bacterium]MBO6565610.1 MerC domain-containing protein [Pseudomonadales bacterium]MBO6594547.1 MerC domain-containing protein [Pseudomonadales bacterium]MBO6659034.1 MerC domain-containing protein [Pseudomonadales bacterium]MBO6701050.1 MerC domain-containing protein [Pseudomonadales bacterium]
MNLPSSDKHRSFLDSIAVVLSGICLLHCLALPLVLTGLPIVNTVLLDEEIFHSIMIIVILPISVIALTIGCRQHRDALTMVLGTIGLSVLTTMALFGHDVVGVTGERIVTSVGGLILAAAHIRNFLCCREDHCEHESQD